MKNSNSIKIISKSISVNGQDLFIDLVKMGDDEGLLVNQAADLFGVTPQNIWFHIKERQLSYSAILNNKLIALKHQGLIGKRTTKACFLPKETLRALVKLINSNVAWDIFNKLWEVTDRAYELHTNQGSEMDLIDVMQNTLNIIANHSRQIQEIREETPEMIRHHVSLALRDKLRTPTDCMKLSDIACGYFPTVSKRAVSDYLANSGHSKKHFLHIDETGIRTPCFAYKTEGLEERARDFFDERELEKETEKCLFWYHPLVSSLMREIKS